MGSGEHGNELSGSKQEIYCEAYWLFQVLKDPVVR